ncbi:WYL domain-containing protein [Dethiosulfovibrio sp. F2B]|uniref:helix-turn-helix transcriptional regulator n=1 Tax=Dethiosulfovibrio faecalis TaxID=2720018 RepID=UPI001F3B43B7|nr:WYL domain-containing protein [Dethiosulfovibrio faecalis]MCF4150953.1 WYL domain-containing protein [Dethiosulfovibrio faecalis]
MPKEIGSNRIKRLNSIMEKLCSRTVLPGKDIRETAESVSARTLQRDLSYLRNEFGADILYDPSSDSYSLKNRGTFVLQIRLRESQIQGLAAGIKMASHFLPHMEEDLKDLWAKMASILPPDLVRKGETLGLASVVSTPVSSMDPRTFHLLIKAIQEEKPVRFSYRSPYDDDPDDKDRFVSPWGVFFQAHAWYLWGSHPKLPQGATYRISRIDKALLWPDTDYESPPENQGLTDYASSCWYAYRGGKEVDVKLRIDPPLSRVIPETSWHPSQTFEEREDGSSTMTVRIHENALESVARWVLASAPFVTVESPMKLADQVEKLLNRLQDKTTTKVLQN